MSDVPTLPKEITVDALKKNKVIPSSNSTPPPNPSP